VSLLLASLLGLAIVPSASPPSGAATQSSRARALERASVRARAQRADVAGLPKPTAAKRAPGAKAARMPGRVGSSGPKVRTQIKTAKGKPKGAAARKLPLRPAPRPKLGVAPCSTITGPSHDGAVRPGLEGLVADKYWVWPNASKLHVHFLDGSPDARAAVAQIAAEWSEFANIDFVFHLEDAAPAQVDIAITFDDPACNSSMGPGSRQAVQWGGPSMRLCHIDRMVGSEFFRRAVLHEFGHALGMHHEHQSPKAAFSWDKPVVYAYYAQIGWDQAFVDQWVFSKVAEDSVRATAWDPDSVMHYEFPAEFTTDRVAIHGGSVLSAEDKRFIAEIYPGRSAGPKPPKKRARATKTQHFTQRRIVLRNDTTVPLVMEVVVERRNKAGAWTWTPSADVAAGERFALAAGAETLLPAALAGRAAYVRARSKDGAQQWSDHVDDMVILAEDGGYDDRVMQSRVIAIAGEPDLPPTLSRDALWDHAVAEFDAGHWQVAADAFTDFIARNGGDPYVPWAQLYLVMGLLEQGRSTDAAYAAYELIVAFPDDDAARYAWFYGGIAALQRGACEDAKGYFEVVVAGGSALPKAWTDAASEHLRAIERSPELWCG
jgi:TolA-binding protein